MFYAELFGMTFDVVEAGRGDKALELARERRPALVVTDLSLPGMSGLDLAKALRADAATASIPILCLSGHGDADTEAAVKAAGINRLLLKPCMPDDLLKHVNELLAGA